jgi:protein SCO1
VVLRRAAGLSLLVLAVTVAGSGAANGRAPSPPFVGPTLEHPSTPPAFVLTDQHGRTVRLAALRGKVVLLTFLYTNCPDLCPLTASNLNTTLRRLGPRRSDVEVLAVSVDPVGDTPQAVRSFVRAHRLLPQFHYLTGRQPTLERVWREYKVTAVRNGKDAKVDHTLYTLLVDRGGTARVLFDAQAGANAITHDVRLLLAD